MGQSAWKVCSSCKKEIGFAQVYYLCSVSTCRSKRTGLFFCSPPCFEAHLPMMRHRDAWAEEERSPTREQAAELARDEAAKRAASETAERGGEARRRIANAETGELEENEKDLPRDVLVVTSKLKKYVRERASMNTSDNAMDVLSDHLRWLSVRALRRAAQEGRKTVLDRDFSAVIKELRGLT